MKSISISTRITIWYGIFMVVICAALMTSVLQLYALRERGAAEMTLIRVVEDVSDSIIDEGAEFSYSKNISYYTRDTYISVYDENGGLICGRRPAGFDSFPPLDLESTAVLRDTAGTEWYVYDTVISMSDADDLYIRGMMNNEAHEHTDVFLTRAFAVILPLLILLAAAGGWFITRKALVPLREIIKVSSEIRRDGDLSRRVPVPQSRDELRELAESFNDMFDSIEEVVSREKQFTSDAAHELRTPLAVIRSQSEYAAEDPGYAPRAAEVINRESRRMSDLISSLLTLARSDAGRLQPDIADIDLAELLEDAAEQTELSAEEKNISVSFINVAARGAGAFTVKSDRDMLIRIIMNLLDNAVKYGRSPGGHIELRLRTEDGFAVCTVSDDGEGIPKEERERIWQRFYRIDHSRSGDDSCGLGLAMVESLSRALGGSVRYVDEEERRGGELPGAVFELRLPIRHISQ